jgi:hypothetical protein
MENNFLKKLGLTFAAAGTIASAEAQQPAPVATETLNVEALPVAKTLWAKDMLAKLDTFVAELHGVEDIMTIRMMERDYLNSIKKHLNEGKGVYGPLDYGTLLESYRKISAHFSRLEKTFAEKDAPDGEFAADGMSEHEKMLKEIEHLLAEAQAKVATYRPKS